MFSYVGLNRRKDEERRVFDTYPRMSYRGEDNRRGGTNSYFFVMGNGGIDGVAVVCLLTLVLIAIVVTV